MFRSYDVMAPPPIFLIPFPHRENPPGTGGFCSSLHSINMLSTPPPRPSFLFFFVPRRVGVLVSPYFLTGDPVEPPQDSSLVSPFPSCPNLFSDVSTLSLSPPLYAPFLMPAFSAPPFLLFLVSRIPFLFIFLMYFFDRPPLFHCHEVSPLTNLPTLEVILVGSCILFFKLTVGAQLPTLPTRL